MAINKRIKLKIKRENNMLNAVKEEQIC